MEALGQPFFTRFRASQLAVVFADDGRKAPGHSLTFPDTWRSTSYSTEIFASPVRPTIGLISCLDLEPCTPNRIDTTVTCATSASLSGGGACELMRVNNSEPRLVGTDSATLSSQLIW
jgi:hypothetical protein